MASVSVLVHENSEHGGSDDYESSGSYSYEDDYSDETSSSCSEGCEPLWMEKVGPRGDLFYVEPLTAVVDDIYDSTHDQSNSVVDKAKDKKPWVQGTKPKATEKLRQWVKHRRKEMKKKFTRTNSGKRMARKSTSEVASVTSENSDINVYLNVDPTYHNHRHQIPLSEKLFGLVLRNCGERILVSELTSDGEAFKEGSIKIGDWLKSVDDAQVSFSSLNSILNSVTAKRQVKLVVQRISKEENYCPVSKNNASDNDFSTLGQLAKNLSDPTTSTVKCHSVYYISFTTESTSKEEDDIIYHYPCKESELLKLKGMFVTLCHMISDVATPPVLSCTVAVGSEVVHVGYVKDGDNMMILSLPSLCANVTEVQHFTSGVVKFLRLQFSSLSCAFGDPENKDYLDQFFCIFFHRLFPIEVCKKCFTKSNLMSILPSVHWFPLPSDLKIVVDDILGQFESADFGDMSDGYYDGQRIYNILGSCFFYKGYLLGSHLDKDDLLDVHLYLQYHNLLRSTKEFPLQQAVVWKEIYPSRRQVQHTVLDPDYIETDGRYFLLVVAVRYSLLATILEAAGCTLSAPDFPPPEPFYVEQVENTLFVFEDSGIFPAITKLLETQVPQLVAPEEFWRSEKSNWDILSSITSLSLSGTNSSRILAKRSNSYSNLFSEGLSNKSAAEVNSFLKKPSEGDLERQLLLSNMGPADGESDAETNNTNDDNHYEQCQRRCSMSNSSNVGSHESDESSLFQQWSMKRVYSSSYDLRNCLSSQDRGDTLSVENAARLISGEQNTLFYYVHMDPAEGVFLAPTDQAQNILSGTLGQSVIQSFYRCCLNMRTTFERSLRNKELSMSAVSPKFGLNSFLQSVYEQGALFHCKVVDNASQKKTAMILDFWVNGRLFFAPEPREVYVCYQDSTQQDVVEMAFHLGFGLCL